jgi:hypothetical protein
MAILESNDTGAEGGCSSECCGPPGAWHLQSVGIEAAGDRDRPAHSIAKIGVERATGPSITRTAGGGEFRKIREGFGGGGLACPINPIPSYSPSRRSVAHALRAFLYSPSGPFGPALTAALRWDSSANGQSRPPRLENHMPITRSIINVDRGAGMKVPRYDSNSSSRK